MVLSLTDAEIKVLPPINGLRNVMAVGASVGGVVIPDCVIIARFLRYMYTSSVARIGAI